MRVLIDGYLLDKPRGLGTYVRELVDSLSELVSTRLGGGDMDVLVLLPRSLQWHREARDCGVRIIRAPSANTVFWEQMMLPWYIHKLRPDVVHCPYNTAPALLRWLDVASVVTVHDTMFLSPLRDFSGSMRQRLGNLYRRLAFRTGTRYCTSVLSPSRKSADQAGLALRTTSRVVPTWPAGFARAASRRPASAPSRPYLLHIGGCAPHKNTARVIAAFRKLAADSLDLVVLGVEPAGSFARQHADRSVLFPGVVSLAGVKWLYENCEACVFPSLEEGYGLPVVESMICGAPLLTSNRDPMMELAGDAALLVDPASTEAIAGGLEQLLKSSSLRSELRRRGRGRLEQLGLPNMASDMRQVYQSARQRFAAP